MFDSILAAVAVARTPGQRVRACARLENAACASRLGHMADMLDDAYRASGSAARDQWRFDNWSSVCARIAAAQEVTSGVASGLLFDAVVLRERLPRVGEVFAEGLISYRLVRLICARTKLVQDPDALRAIDDDLAAALRGWGAKSVDRAQHDVDAVVLIHDPFAVRRTESASRDVNVAVSTDSANGVAYVTATVLATDGQAVDARADALARTVCARDPRTRDQRRGAAMGAMAFGWDRLPCLCESEDCDAASKPAGGGVVIHVIADGGAVDGAGAAGRRPLPDPDGDGVTDSDGSDSGSPSDSTDASAAPDTAPDTAAGAGSDAHPATSTPSTGDLAAQRKRLAGPNPPLLPRPWQSYTLSELMVGLTQDRGELCPARPALIAGGVTVPAPVAAQIATHATIRKVLHPGQAPPEPRYRPSKALADFVRCRDQTCRFPGCRRSAWTADIDHTIPHPYGPTAASNLACLCREHHLLKTFWPDWSSVQHPDGTIVWTEPGGDTTTTYPGSRTLFPELCSPTAEITAVGPVPVKHTAGLTMPTRTVTRSRARRDRIDEERRRNAAAPAIPRWKIAHARRQQRRIAGTPGHTALVVNPDDPPPF